MISPRKLSQGRFTSAINPVIQVPERLSTESIAEFHGPCRRCLPSWSSRTFSCGLDLAAHPGSAVFEVASTLPDKRSVIVAQRDSSGKVTDVFAGIKTNTFTGSPVWSHTAVWYWIILDSFRFSWYFLVSSPNPFTPNTRNLNVFTTKKIGTTCFILKMITETELSHESVNKFLSAEKIKSTKLRACEWSMSSNSSVFGRSFDNLLKSKKQSKHLSGKVKGRPRVGIFLEGQGRKSGDKVGEVEDSTEDKCKDPWRSFSQTGRFLCKFVHHQSSQVYTWLKSLDKCLRSELLKLSKLQGILRNSNRVKHNSPRRAD